MKYTQFIKEVYAKDSKGKPKSKHPSVFKKIDGKPIGTRGKILAKEHRKKFPSMYKKKDDKK